MSHAPEIRREESPAPAGGSLWLIPLLLLTLTFETFTRHLARLKAMRRTRPMPKDWGSFYPDLRSAEWAIHALCHEGARQLILTGQLDLSAIAFDPEPPQSFQPPLPRSARAMHQRIQDTARFHADPERYIRRHAARIRAATTGPAATAGAPRPSVVVVSSFFIFPASAGQRIRAPPWLARRPENPPPIGLAQACETAKSRLKPIPTASSRNKHSAGANTL